VLHILTDRYENKYRKGRLEINETNADKIYYMYLQYVDSKNEKRENTPLSGNGWTDSVSFSINTFFNIENECKCTCCT
jgi:hypothetical protein